MYHLIISEAASNS